LERRFARVKQRQQPFRQKMAIVRNVDKRYRITQYFQKMRGKNKKKQ
jgi:hypothetical protein